MKIRALRLHGSLGSAPRAAPAVMGTKEGLGGSSIEQQLPEPLLPTTERFW